MPTINLTDTELRTLASACHLALDADQVFGVLEAAVDLPTIHSLTGESRRQLADLRDKLRCVATEHAA